MYIKLDYFYFLAFDLEVKSIEIIKYARPFAGEKHDQKCGINYQF